MARPYPSLSKLLFVRGVERRRLHGEFVARGLRSRDEARRTGDYVDADVVLDGLQRKLDAARVRLATKGN